MYEDFVNDVKSASKIVFFGGAGVSTESGIPDFRSSSGVYSQKYDGLSPETIVSHGFFYQNPGVFYRFYRDKLYFPDAVPNVTHNKLAALEKSGKDISIITQNIDGLHQAAGNRKVIELHGNAGVLICVNCGSRYNTKDFSDKELPLCPHCKKLLKPDVVLFGEPLDDSKVAAAAEALSAADICIVGGTSLSVYPAASFVSFYRKDRLYIINKTKIELTRRAVQINAPLGEVFEFVPDNC